MQGWGYVCSLCGVHIGIPTPCLCGFWHGHPYIPVHILEKCFMYYLK